MEKRTGQQNRALHLFYRLLSKELNSAGLDMRKTLKPAISIDWTEKSVKEYLWRPFQKALLDTESTKDLKKQKDIDLVYDNLNRHLSEKFGLSVQFPNEEDYQLYYKDKKKI